jgi:hypothetical protein
MMTPIKLPKAASGYFATVYELSSWFDIDDSQLKDYLDDLCIESFLAYIEGGSVNRYVCIDGELFKDIAELIVIDLEKTTATNP